MSVKAKGNLFIFINAFLWSFLGIATKFLEVADGITVTGFCGGGALITLLIAHRKHKFRFNLMTIGTGVIFAIVNMTFFLANIYTTVTNAIVLQYTSPIFLLLITIFIAKYKPMKLEIGAVFLCVAGIVVFFIDQLSGGQMLGNMLALISGVFFSFYFFLSNKPSNDPVSVLIVTYAVQLVIGIVYMAFNHDAIPHTLFDYVDLAIIGMVLHGVAALFFAAGIQKTTAINANMIALSEVFIAAFWGRLFFGDALGRFSAIGLVMVLVAIITETFISAKNEDASAAAETEKISDAVAESEKIPDAEAVAETAETKGSADPAIDEAEQEIRGENTKPL